MGTQQLSDTKIKSGWVEKYNKGIYRKRWFVLRSNGSLSWFRSEQEYPAKDQARDVIFVKNGLRLVKAYEEDENVILIKTVKEGDNCWYLRIRCPNERSTWIHEIEKLANDDGNGIIEIDTQRFKTESSYKFLEPALAFQGNLPEKLLQKSQKNNLSLNEGIAKAIRMASIPLDFVVPGCGLIVNVMTSLEILLVDGPSAFTFFQNQDLTENGINGKIIEHILLNELVTLQAEIGTLETRYKHIRNPTLSADMKISELITSVNTCEKYLRKFVHTDSVFYKSPMVTAPYLVEFALLFINISSIAKALLLHYKETITEYMRDLITCIETYKDKVINIRLSAIRGNFEDRIKGIWDKVIDDMYPSNTGGFITREAYSNSPLTKGLDSGQKLLEHYRDNVKITYSNYFDPIIEQAKVQCLDSPIMEQMKRVEVELQRDINTNAHPISPPSYGWIVPGLVEELKSRLKVSDSSDLEK